MSRGITKKQRIVLGMIADFLENQRIPPTIRDIAGMYNCSVKGAYDHILALEKKGYIERGRHMSRGINLTQKAEAELNRGQGEIMPLYGEIAAGRPIFADDNVEGTFSYPGTLPEGSEFFALKVRGDSMNGFGIFEGDTVIIRRQDKVENGEVAACIIDDEATLKQVFYKQKKYELRSYNPRYPTRQVKDVHVLGKLYGLFRQY